MEFTGKTAVVTGAAVGIGKATALQLAQKGCNVAMLDWNMETLQLAVDELKGLPGRAMGWQCDAGREEQVHDTVNKVRAEFGRIDILVNNAGIWRNFTPFAESTSDLWKQYIDVNLLGVMYFSRAVIQEMIDAGWGRIINVASVAGVYGNALMTAYSATKGAVISFTKALAKEVTDRNVLVNAISPGSVSDQFDTVTPSQMSFMGRTGTHTENANLICFLASDAASYIAGQNIQIDGCRKKQ